MHYRVHSTKVKPKGWYPTKAEAIPAFEHTFKHLASRRQRAIHRLSAVTRSPGNNLAYPRSTCAFSAPAEIV